MKTLLIIVCLFGTINSLFADQLSCNKDKSIQTIVTKIGSETTIDQFRKDVQFLAGKPAIAVCYLINELNSVEAAKILPADINKHKTTMHVIWSIRALRYLTGMDFKGATKYKFRKEENNRKYWLTKVSEKNLPFFAVWMSRDSIYIAPQDTQKEIIEKWKEWYLIYGKTFKYEPVDNTDKWYF